MLFEPGFTFSDEAKTISVNQYSNEITPQQSGTTRLLDSLIDQYRRDNECTDCDTEFSTVTTDCGEDTPNSFRLTDVVRAKTTRLKKNKQDPDKFAFNQAVEKYRQVNSFIELRLSKPLLKALTEMSLDKPMPIQCACIPVALLNRDICACARTGSGKTLAFILPIIERLTKVPSATGRSVTRALVVSPTRELAIQIFKVAEQLAKHCTKLRIQLAAGGLDLSSQEASLRQNPDLVIATPGRLIDHLSNAPSFNLQHIEYLVLDEADKLLDDYFVEQIGEIVKHCAKQRQTLLFSATMTESVKELATLSLKDPVQVFLNQATAVANRLQQEFVRIRPHREEDREAILVALLIRTYAKRTILFLPTKRDCHRLYVLLSLLGLACAELHGDLTQAQRLDALKRFTDTSSYSASSAKADNGKSDKMTLAADQSPLVVDILLATDLAARGLDIPDVQTVINFTMPQSMKHYVHRVGRTARATKIGRAVSLVGEADRKLLKQIIKEAPFPIQTRVIAADVITKFRERLHKLSPIVDKIILAEVEEKELRAAESQMAKVERMASASSQGDQIECRNRVDWFLDNKKRKHQRQTTGNRQTRSKKDNKKPKHSLGKK